MQPELLALSRELGRPIWVHSADAPTVRMGEEDGGGGGKRGVGPRPLQLAYHKHYYALGEVTEWNGTGMECSAVQCDVMVWHGMAWHGMSCHVISCHDEGDLGALGEVPRATTREAPPRRENPSPPGARKKLCRRRNRSGAP